MRPKRFRDRDDRGPRDRNDRGPRGDVKERPRRERRDVGDMRYTALEVGRDDGVEVRHIVNIMAKATSAAVTLVTLSCHLTPPSSCRRYAGRSAPALHAYPHSEQADEYAAVRCGSARGRRTSRRWS